MAFKVTLSGVNVPVPDDVHTPPAAIVTVPFRITFGLFEQVNKSAPAFTIGPGFTCKYIVSATARQPPLLVEVKINMTSPTAVSALDGV